VQPSTDLEHGRSRMTSRVEVGLVWLLGHASQILPFLVFAIVLALSWGSLRDVTMRDFRAAVGVLEPRWLLVAAAATIANISVMGLYDVVAFRHTRASRAERWRFGAVGFAWSNFLTLGPLAGPAIRFWLYRPAVNELSDLHAGVVSVASAFTAGLVGWTLAVLVAVRADSPFLALSVGSFALVLATTSIVRAILRRTARSTAAGIDDGQTLELAIVGWIDWLLAGIGFIACARAARVDMAVTSLTESFFLGQVLGLASFVPGGFGSSDVFWIAHMGPPRSSAAAGLMAYRIIYYVVPWAIASLLLLTWAVRRTPRRLEVARRIIAALVGGAGVLIMLSSASPALYARLELLERWIPLPVVEAGQVVAALAGLLLLVLARGLARGYRAAFRATLTLLSVACLAAILKGFDWEEAVVLGVVGVAAWSQATLFDRPSHGDWLEGPDVVVAFAALALFLTFGTLSHEVSAATLARWTRIGYRFQVARFARTAASMALAVGAGTLYFLMRATVGFKRLSEPEIGRALALHKRFGGNTNPLMVATGDKALFVDDDRGFCLYRTIGPYLAIFSDPVVRSPSERTAFLDALFDLAGELDRRPVFYQISLDWIPHLHDRGYDFFKLGEEAQVRLDRMTLEGHRGKMNRQVLRRAERDGVRFRILAPEQIEERLPEFLSVSRDWLTAKRVVERQFSVGFFDEAYLRRFRCAVIEEVQPGGRIVAFANLLEGPNREELSVDLMRYRPDGPNVMDFLLVSLFLEGKAWGYERFNLGMAPLASVGDLPGAHARERLARLLFQRGEQWYNFQGLRRYKEKFDPEWVPRYMAYQSAWEWPMAIAHVSALIAGSWSSILMPARAAGAAGGTARQ
jgi:phosphatidylglycerol lysyltransferase